MTRRDRLIAGAVLMLYAGICFAQSYPARQVRVIFAFAAGGAGDVIARAYGDAKRFASSVEDEQQWADAARNALLNTVPHEV